MASDKVAKAFIAAQRAFAPALKSSVNPHFKSKYADLGNCIEAVIDALHFNGFALMQNTFECTSGVTVETVFMHESGETISGGKLTLPAPKNDPQGYGSALTYARRYSLMTAAGISGEDDDGNAAGAESAPSTHDYNASAKRAAANAPVAPKPASASGGESVVFLFGKLKGTSLSSASMHDLDWYKGVVLKGVADPAKAKYKESSLRHLAQVDAAIAALDAPAEPTDGDDYPPYTDDGMPF